MFRSLVAETELNRGLDEQGRRASIYLVIVAIGVGAALGLASQALSGVGDAAWLRSMTASVVLLDLILALIAGLASSTYDLDPAVRVRSASERGLSNDAFRLELTVAKAVTYEFNEVNLRRLRLLTVVHIGTSSVAAIAALALLLSEG